MNIYGVANQPKLTHAYLLSEQVNIQHGTHQLNSSIFFLIILQAHHALSVDIFRSTSLTSLCLLSFLQDLAMLLLLQFFNPLSHSMTFLLIPRKRWA